MIKASLNFARTYITRVDGNPAHKDNGKVTGRESYPTRFCLAGILGAVVCFDLS